MKIEIVTVIVGVSRGKSWILRNFLHGILSLSKKIDINLNIVLGEVPDGTEWGKIPECDFDEVNSYLSEFDFTFNIFDHNELEKNPNYSDYEDVRYPSTGERHSMILDKSIWHISRNSNFDFLLVMDYDSFFKPSDVDDFLETLRFFSGKKLVFGSINGGISIKEIDKKSGNIDYSLYANKSERIERGDRSIIKLPRIHNFFILFSRDSLFFLLENDLFHIYPLKTLGVFDNMHYILYGDSGVFLFDTISKKTGITWILKSPDDMPAIHYESMTLKIAKKEESIKKELDLIFKKMYDEDNKSYLG